MSAAATTKSLADSHDVQDWRRFDAMTDEQRHKTALADPNAQPWTEEDLATAKRRPRAFVIRRAMKLDLATFAELAGVAVETLKAWEAGMDPDAASRQRLDEIANAAALRRRGQRGPQKSPLKQVISIRFDADVLEYFRATGPGWQSRMNDAMRKAAGLDPLALQADDARGSSRPAPSPGHD